MPHHRLHIPNGLAVLAALLLLVSVATDFNTNQEVLSSSQQATRSVNFEVADSDTASDAVEGKRRGLNLSFLLFNR